MANENRCPKCNTPMETFSMILWDGSPHVEDACPLPDQDCLIKSLERQLEEAKARAEDMKQRNARLRQERVDYYNGSALEELNAKYNGLLVSYNTLAQKPGRELILESQLSKAQSERDALKAELEEAKAEAEKEERRHLETIDRRDAAEEACSQMYYLITGNSPHWSNVFGYAQAIEDVDDAQIALHAWGKKGDADTISLKSDLDAALAQVGELGARLEEAEDVLRAMASYVGNGGYNADTVDPKVFEAKIREGIDFIIRVEVNRALSDADTRAHAWWAHTGPHKSLREAIHNGTPAWVRGTEEARKRGAEHGE